MLSGIFSSLIYIIVFFGARQTKLKVYVSVMHFRIVSYRTLDVDDTESHSSRPIRLQSSRLSALQYMWREIKITRNSVVRDIILTPWKFQAF